ncbi:crosslink repair DNA glycosylase YcaQ family protein [Cyclobacterium sp. 1_MG-2023]|uniref:winged helix-turn-helix domain-containing protein n=1 Tax=Cyclobacterium sp. 1_MG-2023 TaxID=3062681 RepID=UPI0026E2E685|nr:crosslink repair DNA glycosylase YcaQ family protein [Cyclobacterium sp. 1_MG-2023]MDO6439585.1 crosslink repair DNA glycosylase YcaQ family protein [Cyclobacterium sp. 1_MG-2023]
MTENLTLQQAQKLVLASQGIFNPRKNVPAIEQTLSTIEKLGYIQIDTISAVQRAHHHTLWSRNPRYQNAQLDELVAERKIFEYWSHAAAYLPMKDYRFSLFRKNALFKGEQNHWFKKDLQLMGQVLNRIKNEGPLMAKNFDSEKKTKTWASKPAKQALENLFMQGELMITSRKNFHKVYDLTERVLPKAIDLRMPSQKEYHRFLINNYLKANGIGQASEISYLLKNTKTHIAGELKEMHSSGELIKVTVNGIDYFALPESLALLDKPLNCKQLKILSPFDNLLIQRKRMLNLFNFDYQIECYLPEAKRKYGYFSLPILWNGSFAARMDCKADRKTSILNIHHLALEEGLGDRGAFALALCKELEAFKEFNNCMEIQLHKTSPSEVKTSINKTLLT